jgi:hypothetical protein
MRIDPREFRALDLEVHSVLEDVPLNDVSVVDLPGGGAGRTLEDLLAHLDFKSSMSASPAVRALFALRALLGRVFGWDAERESLARSSYANRLSEQQRARSLRPTGSSDGPFRLLYQYDREMLSEIRNATVHAFSCMVLREAPGGYRFYWAVYVAPVSRLTPFYMALIEPFRRWIVYPALLKRIRGSWMDAYG